VTWDGEGRDPWLPARLNARLDVAEAEEAIRTSFWAALSKWLVGTSRRVLRGEQPPDLDAVWARVPAWREAVAGVVSGAISDAMATGYRAIMGRAFAWEQRPFASRYLGEVTNRMVRVPDDVYDVVAGQVAQAVNLGESIPKISSRVDTVLSTTGSERWSNRATVVARTESIGALNAGRFDAFNAMAEDSGEPMERVWLSTIDARTRRTHREADGQRVSLGSPFRVGGFNLMFPGDPTGPPQEVIQCRCSMLLVEAGEQTDMSNRQYKGGN
jgi:uncharacterized protein with gpF-like domain